MNEEELKSLTHEELVELFLENSRAINEAKKQAQFLLSELSCERHRCSGCSSEKLSDGQLSMGFNETLFPQLVERKSTLEQGRELL